MKQPQNSPPSDRTRPWQPYANVRDQGTVARPTARDVRRIVDDFFRGNRAEEDVRLVTAAHLDGYENPTDHEALRTAFQGAWTRRTPEAMKGFLAELQQGTEGEETTEIETEGGKMETKDQKEISDRKEALHMAYERLAEAHVALLEIGSRPGPGWAAPTGELYRYSNAEAAMSKAQRDVADKANALKEALRNEAAKKRVR